MGNICIIHGNFIGIELKHVQLTTLEIQRKTLLNSFILCN